MMWLHNFKARWVLAGATICFLAGCVSDGGTISHQSAVHKTSTCLEGNCNNGEGVAILGDGARYAGEFYLGLPNGRGVKTWPNGDQYAGTFKFGRRHGYGQTRTAAGTRTQEWYMDENAADARARLEAKQYAERTHAEDAGFQWGKFIALSTGALAGGMGHLDSARQAEFAGSIVADSMPNQQGVSSFQQTINKYSAPNNSVNTGGAGTSVKPQKPAMQHYALKGNCPSGTKIDISVPYRTQACLNVKIEFAKAYACNEANAFQRVQQNCQRVCGHPSCDE